MMITPTTYGSIMIDPYGTDHWTTPHFALGTAVESPEAAIRRTRTCNEWPDGAALERRNAQAFNKLRLTA